MLFCVISIIDICQMFKKVTKTSNSEHEISWHYINTNDNPDIWNP